VGYLLHFTSLAAMYLGSPLLHEPGFQARCGPAPLPPPNVTRSPWVCQGTATGRLAACPNRTASTTVAWHAAGRRFFIYDACLR
jgi:hypothetical protein